MDEDVYDIKYIEINRKKLNDFKKGKSSSSITKNMVKEMIYFDREYMVEYYPEMVIQYGWK